MKINDYERWGEEQRALKEILWKELEEGRREGKIDNEGNEEKTGNYIKEKNKRNTKR